MSLFLPHMLSIAQVDKIIYGFSILLNKLINRGKQPQGKEYSRILVIRLDEIGDMCYTGPVFEALKERFPDAETTLWCRPFAKSLMADHPSVHKIVTTVSELEGRYDLHVDLRGKWNGLKYSFFHQPDFRVDRGSVRLRHKREGMHPHAIETNFAVIEPLLKPGAIVPVPRLYPSEKDRRSAQEFIQKNSLKKFAVIHAGARRELRRWPAERFAEFSDMLHREKGFQIVFAGDNSERKLVDDIRSKLKFETFATIGELSLGAFAALMQHASLFVGNESGPLHIAALSGAPSLGLYGPGEPRVFYPVTPRTGVIHHILECNPCDQIHCKYPGNPCIQRITLQEVKTKTEELLAGI